MASTGYTRNDTNNNIAEGNVIRASDLDGEFDAIQTAFNAAAGHSHDGTQGEGGPITKLGPSQDVTVSASLISPSTDDTIDIGSSGVQFKDLYIDGQAYIDELGEDLLAVTTVAIQFRDTDISINSSADGKLDIDADEEVEITVSDAAGVVDINADSVTVSNDLKLDSDSAVLSFGADDDVTLTHVADTALLVNDAIAIQFRDSALTINSSTDGQLDIDADAELEITSPTVDINASTSVNISNDLKLDSDSAVLSFGADDDVSLTHVADTGLLLNSASEIQFRDSALTVGSTTDGQLDIDADTTLNITAPTLELDTDSQAIKLGADGEVEINHVADTGIELKTTVTSENTVIDALDIQIETTGSAAAGIGAGLTFSVETGATNFKTIGAIRAVATDVASTSEDADLAFYTMQGGTLTEAFRYDAIDDELYVNGAIETTGNATIGGTLSVAGVYSVDTITSNTADTDLTLSGGGTGIVIVDDHLSVTGNLTVSGTTTTVNSTTVTIDDPIFTLGGDTAPASDDNKDRGIEFRYYTDEAKIGFFGYDDSASEFTFLTDATNTSEVFSGTVADVRVATVKADVLELLDDDASASIKLQAPSDVTTTTTFVLPDGDGTDGQFLSTDGSGQLSFNDPPAAVGTPAGIVLPYAGASAPTGYLLCYGQAVDRTTYADLFTAISTTYGVGDGSTTFNLPDLRGRVVAGQDNMGGTSADRLTDQSGGLDGDTLGDTGGSETHTLTTAEIPAHTHTVFEVDTTDSGTNFGVNLLDGTGVDRTSGSTGGDGAHNNVQPTIILNYIIKT